ncbi:extensin [Scaptodrosophila lebanonensis]|uniref:Extensin n=1 Tax=Drosophila lebanonensis TaxID=7225 RepID=A0A6J2TKT1_DROLE|nr:extensin [Scaptodrosophila lebanonensis]
MCGTRTLLVTLCGVLSFSVYPLCEGARLNHVRFPGPAKIQQLPSTLQNQEAIGAAPYPPAGLTPNPPFELPTEEAAEFPEAEVKPIYEPPDETYGPPDETYGPPDETYGPPAIDDVPVPDVTYGPPDQTYGPPDQTYGPPPPEQTENNVATATLPQSASIINVSSLRPQAQFVLPLVQRLIAFRPLRRPIQVQRKPSKLRTPPRKPQRPANVVNAPKAVFPATQLSLPFIERRTPFRSSSRLVVNAPLKAMKNIASPTFAQLSPTIRRPIFSGSRIIGYSAQAQNCEDELPESNASFYSDENEL